MAETARRPKVSLKGLPWAIDVSKLISVIGVPEIGVVIPHETISECLGLPWRSSRYTGVLGAYRRHLKQKHDLYTRVEPGVGLRILAEPERVDVAEADMRGGMKKHRRAAVWSAAVDRAKLDESTRARCDKIQEVTARLYMTASAATRGLRPPPAQAALPRPA